MDRLKKLIELRAKALAEVDAIKAERKAITDLVTAEERDDLTAEEDAQYRAFTADIKAKNAVVDDLSEQIKDLEAENERAGRDNEVVKRAAKVEVTEGLTYQKRNGFSYGRDLAAVAMGGVQADDARERLRRHAVDVETNKEIRAAINTTDGTGGEFVPPLWVIQDYVKFARAARPYANLIQSRPLPPGIDVIKVPKVATGTDVDVQATQNTDVYESSFTTTSVSADVITIAGFQPVSRQQLDWSPIRFDEEIFEDLLRAYAAKVDMQVIGGTGIGAGQLLGVRNTSGIITITASTGTTQLEKAQTLYRAIADAIARIETQAVEDPEVIVMHPRRWAALRAAINSDGSPAFGGSGAGFNRLAMGESVGFDRVVGELHNLPVVAASHLPTTLGAGTNEDVVHILRPTDMRLYESGPRVEAFRETAATKLQVILQVHGYSAFTAGRQPKSVVEIGGPALTAPTYGA